MKHSTKAKLLSLSAIGLSASFIPSVTSCGQNQHFFTLKGKDLEVEFCDKGASIYSIKYKNEYVTYAPKYKQDFLNDDYYYGKALGRVAGRIKDGKFTINGNEYTGAVNEKSGTKNNCIHGGTGNFASKYFSHKIEEDADSYKVTFTYTSPAMEAGFPEELKATYAYTLYKNASKIDINITGEASGDTIANLGVHPYFRLSNQYDILGHKLTIPASNMAQFDDEGGQVVVGTKAVSDIYNFKNGKYIWTDIAKARIDDPICGGYDHIWKFDGSTKETNVVTLENPNNKYKLQVSSDADAVIIYANCFPHEYLAMNPDGYDKQYAGITIEPIKFFKNDTIATDLHISKTEPYHRSITYDFSKTE